VAVRIPAHPIARALIEAAALPVAAPSANLFSRPSPTRAAHVLEDLNGRIDLLIDGGPTSVGVESTVLDLTAEPATILRPGAVTLEMIHAVLPRARFCDTVVDGSTGMRSPGLLTKHYSPRAPLTLYRGEVSAALREIALEARAGAARGQRIGLMLADEDEIGPIEGAILLVRVGRAADGDAIAAGLYAALRAMDAQGVDRILTRSFGAVTGIGAAIADRLTRAAAGRVVEVG
jgi:L-threonylcarbamoyladenylate synthase